MSSAQKLIVFDVDGTMLDSFGMFERVLAQYSLENNLPMPCFETFKIGYGDPRNHDFKWGVDVDTQIKHLKNCYVMADQWAVSNDPDKTPLLFEGVENTLNALKQAGHTLAIVTSKAEEPLMHMIEHHGLYTLFSAHRCWNDIKRRNEKEKPEPDMLLSVMRELGATPAETVMIGDTTMDVKMGRNAATRALGVAWGCHPKDLLFNAGAHDVVDTSFGDITPRIEQVFAV